MIWKGKQFLWTVIYSVLTSRHLFHSSRYMIEYFNHYQPLRHIDWDSVVFALNIYWKKIFHLLFITRTDHVLIKHVDSVNYGNQGWKIGKLNFQIRGNNMLEKRRFSSWNMPLTDPKTVLTRDLQRDLSIVHFTPTCNTSHEM